MTKRVEKDGKHYRIRRGELVEIPEEWVGQVPHPQTIRKRNTVSRRTRKNRNRST